MFNKEYYDAKKTKLFQKFEQAKIKALEAHVKITTDLLDLQKEINDELTEIGRIEKENMEQEEVQTEETPEVAQETPVAVAGEPTEEQTTVADENSETLEPQQ